MNIFLKAYKIRQYIMYSRRWQ